MIQNPDLSSQPVLVANEADEDDDGHEEVRKIAREEGLSQIQAVYGAEGHCCLKPALGLDPSRCLFIRGPSASTFLTWTSSLP